MNAGSAPEMSVVLVTIDRYERLREPMRHLRRQTASDRLEVVLVVPSAELAQVDEAELQAFARARVVEIGAVETLGASIAAGYRAAGAPVVAYCEEHAYPEPGWAEALIEAHRGPWAAVAGTLRNANPARAVSWASLLADFAPFVESAGPPGERDDLPWHHTSYKRELLRDRGPDLDTLLEAEWCLQHELRSAGHRMYLESGARIAHLNPSRLVSYLRSEFLGARVFAGRRAQSEGWSTARRLAYIAGTPAIPLVRVVRLRRDVRRLPLPAGRSLRIWVAIGVGLVASTLGQLVGHALGPGSAARRRVDIELNRAAHLAGRDDVPATP